MSKQVLILAGPNGAGKTTFAREFLTNEANCPTFLNADIIAAELSPQRPEQVAVRAARFMLQRFREEVAKGQSFAFETTLANRSYAHSIREWQAAGYHVSLWFLALRSVDVGTRTGGAARLARRPQHHRGGRPAPFPGWKSEFRRALPRIGRRVGAVRQFRCRPNPARLG